MERTIWRWWFQKEGCAQLHNVVYHFVQKLYSSPFYSFFFPSILQAQYANAFRAQMIAAKFGQASNCIIWASISKMHEQLMLVGCWPSFFVAACIKTQLIFHFLPCTFASHVKQLKPNPIIAKTWFWDSPPVYFRNTPLGYILLALHNTRFTWVDSSVVMYISDCLAPYHGRTKECNLPSLICSYFRILKVVKATKCWESYDPQVGLKKLRMEIAFNG